ncbi:MAG TPA: hypothetical protein VF881_15020 [Polyangiaceae bacterium]
MTTFDCDPISLDEPGCRAATFADATVQNYPLGCRVILGSTPRQICGARGSTVCGPVETDPDASAMLGWNCYL